MAGVDGASHAGVYKLAVGAYRLEQRLKLGVHELCAQLFYRLVDLSVDVGVVDDLKQA